MSLTVANVIKIDDAQNPPTGVYTMQVIATALDETGTELTGHTSTADFKVTVYTLTASSLVDQVYSIGQSAAFTYTWPVFSTLLPPVTYTFIVDDGSGVDATTKYSWLSADQTTLTILSANVPDIGEYNLILRGTVADTSQYPSSQTTAETKFKVFLMDVVTAP